MGRDLVAGALRIDPDSFDLDVDIVRPDDVAAILERAAQLDEEAHVATTQAARSRREAAHTLRHTYRMSVMDAARVLGVTRARVYQLLAHK